jgi:hypothetical protein
MNYSREKEAEPSWCKENWWVVGIVIGLIAFGVASAYLLGLFGSSSANQSNQASSVNSVKPTVSSTAPAKVSNTISLTQASTPNATLTSQSSGNPSGT